MSDPTFPAALIMSWYRRSRRSASKPLGGGGFGDSEADGFGAEVGSAWLIDSVGLGDLVKEAGERSGSDVPGLTPDPGGEAI